MSDPDLLAMIEEVSTQRDLALDGYERCLADLGKALDLVAQLREERDAARAERDGLRTRCDHLSRDLRYERCEIDDLDLPFREFE